MPCRYTGIGWSYQQLLYGLTNGNLCLQDNVTTNAFTNSDCDKELAASAAIGSSTDDSADDLFSSSQIGAGYADSEEVLSDTYAESSNGICSDNNNEKIGHEEITATDNSNRVLNEGVLEQFDWDNFLTTGLLVKKGRKESESNIQALDPFRNVAEIEHITSTNDEGIPVAWKKRLACCFFIIISMNSD